MRRAAGAAHCPVYPCLSAFHLPLQAPDADTLEKFLARLPLMFKASLLVSARRQEHAMLCACMSLGLSVGSCRAALRWVVSARCCVTSLSPAVLCARWEHAPTLDPCLLRSGGHSVPTRLLWADKRAGHARHRRPGGKRAVPRLSRLPVSCFQPASQWVCLTRQNKLRQVRQAHGAACGGTRTNGHTPTRALPAVPGCPAGRSASV